MVRNAWAAGFFAAAGLAAGLGLALVLQPQRLDASTAMGATDGCMMATGRSNLQNVDMLWALDDKGLLTCLVFNAQGRPIASPQLNIVEVFGKRAGGAKKPKLAMVTGRFEAQGQNADVLYVMDSATNKVAMINLTNNGLAVVWQGTTQLDPRAGARNGGDGN